MNTLEDHRLKAILMGLRTSKIKEPEFLFSLDELALLAETAQITVLGTCNQSRQNPDPRSYFGAGKLNEAAELIKEFGADLVIVDDELTPSQQKNMEITIRLECGKKQLKIIDRTELILLIFAQRANTKEANLQVELAALSYQLPRLSRLWMHLHRQVGKIGTRGPGETQIEVDRRTIRNKIAFLNKKIEEIKHQRELHRKKRTLNSAPVAAIIGYTNAGKSTLMNTLTSAFVVAEDKLFATLDTTTRKMILPGNQEILLIDTVGFIHKLPHSLISAFRATLEEVKEADFFIHVVDISAPDPLFLINSVYAVLEELKVENKPIITLFNKLDKSYNEALYKQLREKFYPSAGISLQGQIGVDNINFLIEELLSQYRKTYNISVPFDRMSLINFLHQNATILNEDYAQNEILIELEIPQELYHHIHPFILEK